MTTTQEPKYKIAPAPVPDGYQGETFLLSDPQTGQVKPCRFVLVNRVTGEPIPDDEPAFILRARDFHAVITLEHYLDQIRTGNTEHIEAVELRLAQFERFASEHADRMKEPDTVLTNDWPRA